MFHYHESLSLIQLKEGFYLEGMLKGEVGVIKKG